MTIGTILKGVKMPLDPSFPGQYYPPTTIVSFPTKKGEKIGEVQKLNKKYARVTVGSDETIWKVPYGIMTVVCNKINPEITLQEIYDFAYDKLEQFDLDEWVFGFDLAQVRGGICRYTKKRITLSVTYCLTAPKEEVLDTVLHEIAHALAGYKAGHGKTWRGVAEIIGCSGEVYHTIKHGQDRWHGFCPCGKTWKRKKLQRRVRNGTCPSCNEKITWEAIT